MAEEPKIREVAIYEGGPTLYIPEDWSDERIAATLEHLRAKMLGKEANPNFRA